MGNISSNLVANSSRSTTTKLVCGLDLGDKKSHVCVCTADGEILERAKIDTTEPGLARYFQNQAPMRIALETGTHSPWVSRLLRRWGHEVLVANPRKVRLIGNSRHKNDRLDALSLADLASVRPRLLYPVEHTTAQAQADRGVLRSRDALVRVRASLILHTRGLVKAQGSRLPSCSAESFAKKVKPLVPAALAPALLPMLSQIAELSATIRGYDKQIQKLIRTRYPQAEKLQQINGVGLITSLAFVLCLGDPKRFSKSRQVGAYFGLVPAQRDSGESTPQMRISKEGNPYARRLLIQCSQYILGPFGEDSDLRRFGQRLAALGGGKSPKKRAIVAVARKLSVLMHRLLVTEQPYQALRGCELQTAA
jgi:transposase